MGHETSKASRLASRQKLYARYLIGDGVDIGCGDDPLVLPGQKVDKFDKEQGDAEEDFGILPFSYDFIYSSHCAEHMTDLPKALRHWSHRLRPNGTIMLICPEYRLYERCQWPSPFNSDHKCSFTIFDGIDNPHEKVYSLGDMIRIATTANLDLVHAALETDRYDFSLLQSRFLIDQTAADACANIVYVFRKK